MPTIIAKISSSIIARKNCAFSRNTEWFKQHSRTLESIQLANLPCGSGVDMGSRINLDRSTDKAIYIDTAFHHMDENGCYDGWTDHTVKVFPTFDGFDLTISGRNRNDIKDYLGDLFFDALRAEFIDPV